MSELTIYRVGGSVRDHFLGISASDQDFVVVGATPELMRSKGFLPVGRDFPVFLHPHTKEAYALARTERKNGRGYHGFIFHTDPSVTLEGDLARRDLTINAMAMTLDSNQVIDPYRGMADLQAKILRHVSPAFVEDPLRVLRVARFAARFSDFSVAPETTELMRVIVQRGELADLPLERVWHELSKGLLEAAPQRMFDVLHQVGALAQLLPKAAQLWGNTTIVFDALFRHANAQFVKISQQTKDAIADQSTQTIQTHQSHSRLVHLFSVWAMVLYGQSDQSTRFLVHDFGAWRLPANVFDCAQLALKHRAIPNLEMHDLQNPEMVIAVMRSCDAVRRRDRWRQLVAIWLSVAQFNQADSACLSALQKWADVIDDLAHIKIDWDSVIPSERTAAQWQARLAHLRSQWC